MAYFRSSFLILTISALGLSGIFYSCSNHSNNKGVVNSTADSMGFSPPAHDPFIKNGEEKIRYPNGNIQMQGSYVNNKRDGNWFSWYGNGKPWSETSFDNGIKNGPTKTWYENGKLRYSGQYKNDQKAGIWKYYEESGALAQEVNYDQPK